MSLSRRRFLSVSGAAMAAAATHRFAQGCLPPPPDPNELVAGNTAFALDLYGKLAAEPGNLFLSPFSISTALAMTSAGARNKTLDEMNKVLHLPENPHPAFSQLSTRVFAIGQDIKRPYDLTMANAIWAQQGFPWRDEFKELTQKHYGAGLAETDFAKSEAARAAINDWVKKETRDKVKDLIPTGVINALTRMVLANAVYFKGDWASQFKKDLTKEQDFHVTNDKTVKVPLMEQTGTFGYTEEIYDFQSRAGDAVQLLELPYDGGDLSMVFLLPERRALATLERQLSAKKLDEWIKALRKQKVKVQVPRFKFEMAKPLSLNQPLQALGMKDAFDDLNADFTGLHTGKEILFISHVLHKAYVEVNEQGTEAAAATSVIIKERAAAPRETVFRADRPFLFLIRENKTGGILFLGRMTNPRE